MFRSKLKDNDLILLVYTSMIKPELSRSLVILNSTTTEILGAANKNNQGKQLTGVLYYGHQHFFQCIEGPKDAVNTLFEVIKNDNRHEQVQLLTNQSIQKRLFSSWYMKFVHSDKEISEFFSQLEHDYFVPEKLDKNQLEKFILLLQKL